MGIPPCRGFMKTRKLLLALVILLVYPCVTSAEITFTSLPNPNVYLPFIIMDQGYLEANFVPARTGLSEMLALLKSSRADVALLNYNAAKKVAEDYGWSFEAGRISKAIHLISTSPVTHRKQMESLRIVSAFPGGSPAHVYSAGNFNNQPRYTDIFLSQTLFLQGRFDAILLPEPHISELVEQLRQRQKKFFLYDMHEKTGYNSLLNGIVIRRERDRAPIVTACKEAVDFLYSQPQQAVDIIASSYKKYFGKSLPREAVLDALQSQRLYFVDDK
ncbi:MAG: hypothetical protein ACQEQK_06820 [Thermodesulfobacteriota bacterium]